MKHFIDINNFKKKEIDEIISLAKKIKKYPKKYSSSCKDKTLGLIFEKQSLRTRLSFNVGMQKLGGSVLELQSKDIVENLGKAFQMQEEDQIQLQMLQLLE